MRTVVFCLALIASIGAAVPSFAQCAGCGADKNRADREATDRAAKDQADRADKDRMKDALGDGMARDAADKAQQHNDRNDRAMKEIDN